MLARPLPWLAVAAALAAALAAGAAGCSRGAPPEEGPAPPPSSEELWPGLLPVAPNERGANGGSSGGESTGAVGEATDNGGTAEPNEESAPVPDAAPPAAPRPEARPSRAGPSKDAGAADAGDEAPLRAWMKEHPGKAVVAKSFLELEAAFARIAQLAPPAAAYPHWISIARDGADAARVLHLEAVKAACRGCHSQYRDRYRRELRRRPLPS